MLDELIEGPVVLVGSSMGGWIACLAAMAGPSGSRAMVLVAPAPDFTEKLMAPEIPPEGRAGAGRATASGCGPRDYGDPYPITAALLEDGARWSILPGPVPIEVPVRILQGGEDPDVPWRHALELAQAIKSDDVVFTLIKDGDHRLSRPQDIERLIAAVEELSVYDAGLAPSAARIAAQPLAIGRIGAAASRARPWRGRSRRVCSRRRSAGPRARGRRRRAGPPAAARHAEQTRRRRR